MLRTRAAQQRARAPRERAAHLMLQRADLLLQLVHPRPALLPRIRLEEPAVLGRHRHVALGERRAGGGTVALAFDAPKALAARTPPRRDAHRWPCGRARCEASSGARAGGRL